MSRLYNYVAPFVSEFADSVLTVSDALGCVRDPDFLIDRKYFNNNLVMYVLTGRLIVEQYGQCFQIVQGEGILMDLKQPHRYYLSKDEPSEIIWFHFRGKPCEPLVQRLQGMEKLPLMFQDTSFERRFERLNEYAAAEGIPDEFMLSAEIYSIVTHICRITRCNENNSSDSFEKAVKRYVWSRIDDKIDIDEFAAHMNLSKSHFCRKFHQEFACTPLAYIQDKKIYRAKRLLIYSNLSISEIAYQLSFYDQSHFNRVFTKLAGISPGKFRKTV